nr:GAF domain-containing protein [Euryhalocaulis sp.]
MRRAVFIPAIGAYMPLEFKKRSLMPAETKTETYARLKREIDAVLEGERNQTARYATAACLLSEAFDHYYWTGFYVVDPEDPAQLVVGPYQGTLGCLRIPVGKGVCGTAAERRETVIVADVEAFPGHIACDSRTRSEIVTPVMDAGGRVAAVLDVDSTDPDAFDAEDRAGLEAICAGLLNA